MNSNVFEETRRTSSRSSSVGPQRCIPVPVQPTSSSQDIYKKLVTEHNRLKRSVAQSTINGKETNNVATLAIDHQSRRRGADGVVMANEQPCSNMQYAFGVRCESNKHKTRDDDASQKKVITKATHPCNSLLMTSSLNPETKAAVDTKNSFVSGNKLISRDHEPSEICRNNHQDHHHHCLNESAFKEEELHSGPGHDVLIGSDSMSIAETENPFSQDAVTAHDGIQSSIAIQMQKQDVNNLKKKNHELKHLLRKSKDENELLEFRILELETELSSVRDEVFREELDCKIPCLECSYLKGVLSNVKIENEGMKGKLNANELKQRELMDENMKLHLEIISLKDEISQLLEQSNEAAIDGHQLLTNKLNKDLNGVSGNPLLNVQLISSEDEGLGEFDSSKSCTNSNEGCNSSRAGSEEDEYEDDHLMGEDSFNERMEAGNESTNCGNSSHEEEEVDVFKDDDLGAVSPSSTLPSTSSSSSCYSSKSPSSPGRKSEDASCVSSLGHEDEDGTRIKEKGEEMDCEGMKEEAQIKLLALSPSSSSASPFALSEHLPEISFNCGDESLFLEKSTQTTEVTAISTAVVNASSISNESTSSYPCSEDSNYKDDLLKKLEMVMKERDELCARYEKLLQEKSIVDEQLLELEEAENDSRLSSQKLTIQVNSLLTQIESLHRSLSQSSDEIESNKLQMSELMMRIREYQTKINQLEMRDKKEIDLSEDERNEQNDSFMKSFSNQNYGHEPSNGDEDECTTNSVDGEVTNFGLLEDETSENLGGDDADGDNGDDLEMFLSFDGMRKDDPGSCFDPFSYNFGPQITVKSSRSSKLRANRSDEILCVKTAPASREEDERCQTSPCNNVPDLSEDQSGCQNVEEENNEIASHTTSLQSPNAGTASSSPPICASSNTDPHGHHSSSHLSASSNLEEKQKEAPILSFGNNFSSGHQRQQEEENKVNDFNDGNCSMPSPGPCFMSTTFQLVPLCERVKPKKIDLSSFSVSSTGQLGTSQRPLLSTNEKEEDEEAQQEYKSSSYSSSDSVSEMSRTILLLEANEDQLKSKLIELESINKEFVHELELREKLFLSRELQEKEWNSVKDEKLAEISALDVEIKQIDDKINMILGEVAKLNGQEADREGETKMNDQHNKILLNSLKEYQVSLQSELSIKSQELHQLCQNHDHKIKMLQEEHSKVSSNLFNKMSQMETQSTSTLNQLQQQRNQLHETLKCNLQSFQEREINLRSKIQLLESNINKIGEPETKQVEDERNHKIEQLSSLLGFEREKVDKLTTELQAYKKTIEKGDEIIKRLEREYQDKIENLEAQLSESREEVCTIQDQLEKTMTMCGDGKTNERLMNELMEFESRETELREKLCKYEKNETKMKEKLQMLIKERNELETEVQDQEQIVRLMFKMKTEIESLKRANKEKELEREEITQLLEESRTVFERRESHLVEEVRSLKKERNSLQESIDILKCKVKEHMLTSQQLPASESVASIVRKFERSSRVEIRSKKQKMEEEEEIYCTPL